MTIITLGFLNIDYLFKVLFKDDNFFGFSNTENVKTFTTVKQALKYAEQFDIKNLKVLQIDEFNNVKTLKYIK